MQEQVETLQRTTGRRIPSYRALTDYFTMVDLAIAASPYALLPAKNVEFGRVDQPMLNHIRNGVCAMVELNEVLLTLKSSAALSEAGVREAVALFAVHNLHQCIDRDRKEQTNTPAAFVETIADEFGLAAYAPTLTPADYRAVSVALQSARGDPAGMSRKGADLLRWLKFAETLAGQMSSSVTTSMRTALEAIDPGLAFSYHRFQEPIGILTNLVHTGVSAWMGQKGVYPLLVFETGVLYIGPHDVEPGALDLEAVMQIYREFEHVLNSCHAAISDPREFSRSISVQGTKGLYSAEDASFFYSGIPTVIKGFMAAAVLREEAKNRTIEIDLVEPSLLVKKANLEMQHPPATVIDILRAFVTRVVIDGQAREPGDIRIVCRPHSVDQKKYVLLPESVLIDGRPVEGTQFSIEGTGLLPSQVGYRHHLKEDFGIDIGWEAGVISYARAVAGLRRAIIVPLAAVGALSTTDPVLETCRLFQIDEDLARRMAEYARDHRGNDHHTVGGYWNYGYAIARALLDHEVNGVRFRDLTPDRKIEYLESLTDAFLSGISTEALDSFRSKLLYPYQEKLLVWFSENLNLNGSIAYGIFENKISKFGAYCRGRGICRLTGDAPFDNEEKVPSRDASMLGFSFSNRGLIGGAEPKLSVSVPVEVELGLREIGHQIRKGSDKLYFRLIPDSFHTPLMTRILSDLLSRFNTGALTNVRALALRVLDGTALDPAALAQEFFAESGGRSLFRYTATGFTGCNSTLYATYDLVFKKVKENETEFWFFGAYLGMLLAAATGCRVVVGDNPICMTSGNQFCGMVHLEALPAAVKHLFGDTIRLSTLPLVLRRASLLVVLGYEYRPYNRIEDRYFSKHLQTIRNRACPGSTLLKQLWRMNSRKDAKKRVQSRPTLLLEWALELDWIAGDQMTIQTLHELALLGMDVAVPKGYEPYKLEHLFREAVRAILTRGTQQYQREDYVDAVMGRLLKMMKRAGEHQFYGLNGQSHSESTLRFAEAFVDHVFYGLFDGNPGKLKRAENDLADGYYAATLQLRNQMYAGKKTGLSVESSNAGNQTASEGGY
ncbi:CRISPR-associated protein Csc3 [Methanosphaerula palustris E1-9c]|uniref:CRISPR-associated protein Csc3 n=2 Tax=Methanosphaerula palustris TaxID=475088 RepID=B8GIG8_METPE|nr:CRISPR-associated protein Csc3 [Methanosphaerula palustris E1-9c]